MFGIFKRPIHTFFVNIGLPSYPRMSAITPYDWAIIAFVIGVTFLCVLC